MEVFFGSNTTLFSFNVFLDGILKPISVEHNKRSGFATQDMAGKPMKSWQVKDLFDAFIVPYNFVAEGLKFTIQRGVDLEGNPMDTLELFMEGIPFKKHPYLDINFGEKLFTLSVLTHLSLFM